MIKQRELPIGEHWYLSSEELFGKVIAGKLDIFADFCSGEDRFFLMEVTPKDLLFSKVWDTNLVNLYAIAREQTTIEIYDVDELNQLIANDDVIDIRAGMIGWLLRLLDLEWLHRLAVRNWENIGNWVNGEVITKCNDKDLYSVFCEEQQKFCYLCVKEFANRQNLVFDRVKKRKSEKAYSINRAIEFLTGATAKSDVDLEDAGFGRKGYKLLIERAAKYFHMDEVSLQVPEFIDKVPNDWEYLKFLLRKQGLRSRKVLLEKDCFKMDCGVFLVQYGENWALALPDGPEKYKLLTGDGNSVELTDVLSKQLNLEAYQLYGGLPNRSISKKEYFQYLGKQWLKADFVVIFLTSIVLGIIPLFTPLITESVFSNVVPIRDHLTLSAITFVLLISGFTTAMLTAVRSITVNRIVAHFSIDSQSVIWSRILSMPVKFYQQYPIGELVQRLNSAQMITSLLNGTLVSGLFNMLFSLWSVALMFYYSMKLTLFCLAVWIVYLLLIWFIHWNYPALQRQLVKVNNDTSAKIVQIFNGLTKFRSRGAEEEAFLIWSTYFTKTWKTQLKLRWLNNFHTILTAILPNVLFVLIFSMVGMWALEGKEEAITSTEYMAFVAAYSGFNAAIVAMVPQVIQLLSLPAYLDNLEPFLTNVPEITQDKIDAGQLFGEIELSHISFGYDSNSLILNDISLKIEPGKKVAIVGPSGCGKSTLLRVILGFETPNKGIVSYDGKDLSELNLASVRRQMGVVMQDGKLLTGDILHNIIGSYNLTINDAWAAARKVALADDIEEMPMGMQTIINEGSSNISGGQRQRILLARSIVNNPVILILDEATSALDNTAQSIVAESLNKMNCTQIIVAHRLSTIRNADHIIVLKDGSVAESGTFNELLAKGGIFAELVNRQMA